MKAGRVCLALLLVAGLVAHDASAQAKQDFYRWKDASGVTHYSETPPPQQQASRVSVDGRAPAAPPSSIPTVKSQAPATATGQQKQPDDGRLATAEAAARQRNCTRSRANLQTLGGKAMVVDGTDASVARRLTPDELASSKRVAQADVDTYCDGAGK
jgi:hypothetical protein